MALALQAWVDCATITNTHPVNVDVNTTVGPDNTLGPNSGGGCGGRHGDLCLDLLLPTPLPITAYITLADGVTLTSKGYITAYGSNSGGATPDFCGITGNAGSTLKFDSSSNPGTQYYLGPDLTNTNFNWAYNPCTGNDTTEANRFTITSNTAGGIAYMSNGANQGCLWQLTHATISYFGDGSHPALACNDSSTNYGQDSIVSTINDLILSNSGEIEFSGGSSATQWSMQHIQCINPVNNGCFRMENTAPGGGAVRVFSFNSEQCGQHVRHGRFNSFLDGATVNSNFFFGNNFNWSSFNRNGMGFVQPECSDRHRFLRVLERRCGAGDEQL